MNLLIIWVQRDSIVSPEKVEFADCQSSSADDE